MFIYLFIYIIILEFQHKRMSHLKISEVQGEALAPFLDSDIICCSVLKNLLNVTNVVLRKQNCISCSCYSFSLKMAYAVAIFE